MSILATSPDLDKIISKAINRIGESHALTRDNSGVEMNAKEVEEDRVKFRNESTNKVIEESLKAAADEMAERMVLENTIEGMIKDVVSKQPENNNLQEDKDNETPVVNETTKEVIKKIVNKKLKQSIQEVKKGDKVPGYDAYEKAHKKSKQETDQYHKDTKKKFSEYETFEGNDNPDFPHQEMSKTNNKGADGQYQYYRNNDEDAEFIEDFAHPGLIDFDINNINMERLTSYLEGSSETGNAQKDENGEDLGNVVSSDLGEKMLKSSERRKEKIAANKASMTNLRGYTPDVQKVKQVKEDVTTDIDKMKKLWIYNKTTQ